MQHGLWYLYTLGSLTHEPLIVATAIFGKSGVGGSLYL